MQIVSVLIAILGCGQLAGRQPSAIDGSAVETGSPVLYDNPAAGKAHLVVVIGVRPRRARRCIISPS